MTDDGHSVTEYSSRCVFDTIVAPVSLDATVSGRACVVKDTGSSALEDSLTAGPDGTDSVCPSALCSIMT